MDKSNAGAPKSEVGWLPSGLLDQPVQQRQRWAYTNALGSQIVFAACCGHLPRLCFRKASFKVAKTLVHIGVAPLAFYEQPGPLPVDHDEVDFAAIGITEIAQLAIKPVRVLLEVHPFEQV